MKSIKNLVKYIPGFKAYMDYRFYARKMSKKELTRRLMDKYQQTMGYRMDINHPVTFTEKMQWYKLFYKGDGNLIRIVDKYLFKEYIKEKLGEGYTIPLIGVWESMADLERDWSKLPKEFCLKSTLQSDGKCIKFIHDKDALDVNEFKNEVKEWFKKENTLVNSYLEAYRDGKPRVLAEQYLENVSDQLYDYKLFCFNGIPHFVYVAQEHFSTKGSTITFYDMDWNKLDVQYGHHAIGDMPCPKHWKEMVEISKKLSAGFPHIRVDFFDTEEKLYVAELTLYPGGGNTKYHPESFNKEMGDLFILPMDGRQQ